MTVAPHQGYYTHRRPQPLVLSQSGTDEALRTKFAKKRVPLAHPISCPVLPKQLSQSGLLKSGKPAARTKSKAKSRLLANGLTMSSLKTDGRPAATAKTAALHDLPTQPIPRWDDLELLYFKAAKEGTLVQSPVAPFAGKLLLVQAAKPVNTLVGAADLCDGSLKQQNVIKSPRALRKIWANSWVAVKGWLPHPHTRPKEVNAQA